MVTHTFQDDKNILGRFAVLLQKGRLAHAYLFVGPGQSGKTATALAIAKLINCEQNMDGRQAAGCDRCPSCLKINAGHHVDVSIIDSGEDPTIKIARIRELIGRMQLRPFEARKKVYIIKKVEELTLEGGNALLKTLEEPTDNSLLILTTSVPEKIIATIRSRCHTVNFFPAADDVIFEQIRKDGGYGRDEARFLAHFAQGCLGRARQLGQSGFLQRKNEAIDRFVMEKNSDDYIKEVAADKELTKEFLGVLLSWFRDIALLKAGMDKERFAHADRIRDLVAAAPRYTQAQVMDIIAQIVNASNMLAENLNVKIPLSLLKEKI